MRSDSTVLAEFFLDTNLLVYAHSADDVEKRARAIAVLEAVLEAGTGSISVQVIGEFYDTITRKGTAPLSAEEARAVATDFLRPWPVFGITAEAVGEAMGAADLYQMRYYDALIWATAKLNGVPYLLSEDGQDGQIVEGVQRVNPLLPSFDLGRLS
jgi:predicted nucleic acid-binding protein